MQYVSVSFPYLIGVYEVLKISLPSYMLDRIRSCLRQIFDETINHGYSRYKLTAKK